MAADHAAAAGAEGGHSGGVSGGSGAGNNAVPPGGVAPGGTGRVAPEGPGGRAGGGSPGSVSDGPSAGGRGGRPAGGGAGASAGGSPGGAGTGRAGRNLPAAIAVGLALGALALITLFTVKATFLIYVGAAAGLALWELARALQVRQIRLPLLPLAAAGVAMVTLAYWEGERALVAALGVAVMVILGWRLPGGPAGYLRDITAGLFALAYLPLLASFVALMLAAPDGARRTLIFLLLPVCSDIGGYFAGIAFGRHRMVPVISPKKTWEGFAGSVLACLIAGGVALPLLLHRPVWQGAVIGAVAVIAATLGDLVMSMIKRDLEIKDMGTFLPGHGGILDRIDSLLITAPVLWLLLAYLPS